MTPAGPPWTASSPRRWPRTRPAAPSWPSGPPGRPTSLIARYTRRELGEAWSDHARFDAMRRVEVAACEEMEGPTAEELDATRASPFTVEAIDEREKVTDHDTAAFVDILSESAGPAGRWVHYRTTARAVLAPGLALQVTRAAELILPDARRLTHALAAQARTHVDTLCAG